MLYKGFSMQPNQADYLYGKPLPMPMQFSISSAILLRITAISIYAVASNTMTFVTMPASGISRNIQPLLGSNYGFGHSRRFMQTFRLATGFSAMLVLQEECRMMAARPA